MAEFVRGEKQGQVGIVTIARPERRNALNLQVKREIVEHVQALAVDADVAAIVLTGEGGYFVAGTDIAEMAQMTPTDHVRLDTDRVFHVVRQSSKPVIAAVEGSLDPELRFAGLGEAQAYNAVGLVTSIWDTAASSAVQRLNAPSN